MSNTLGVNISSRRHELNFTQEQLSDLTNLSINYISRLERGDADNVSSKTLLKIAKALDTSMDKLMNSTNSTHDMGYYQNRLWKELGKMKTEKAEQISKSVLKLININQK